MAGVVVVPQTFPTAASPSKTSLTLLLGLGALLSLIGAAGCYSEPVVQTDVIMAPCVGAGCVASAAVAIWLESESESQRVALRLFAAVLMVCGIRIG